MNAKNFGLKIQPLLFFVISGLLLAYSVYTDKQYYKPLPEAIVLDEVQGELGRKHFKLMRASNKVTEALEDKEPESLWTDPDFFDLLWDKDNLHLYVYESGRLVYWNNNKISSSRIEVLPSDTRIMRLRNAWCLVYTQKTKNYKVVTASPIKYEFPLNNTIVEDRFVGFPLLNTVSVSIDEAADGMRIEDANGEYRFTLTGEQLFRKSGKLKDNAVHTFHLAIIFLLLGFLLFFNRKNTRKKHTIGLLVFLVVASVFLYIVGHLQIPRVLFETELFSPTVMAFPYVFTSLGITMYVSLFWLVLCFVVFRFGFLAAKQRSSFTLLLAGIVLFFFFGEIFSFYLRVIDNSTICFELYKVSETNLYSYIAYTIFLAFFGGWMLLLSRLLKNYKNRKNSLFNWHFLIASVLVIIFELLKNGSETVVGLTIGLIITYLVYGFNYYWKSKVDIVQFSIFSLLFTTLFAYGTWIHDYSNDNDKHKTALINLSSGILTERDNIAEVGLFQIAESFKTDSNIIKSLAQEVPNIDRIHRYLQNEYFFGYWKKYNLQVIACWPTADLLIEETGEFEPCYSYFDEKLAMEGEKLDTSGFYFLDNKNGRVSYFGKFPFKQIGGEEITLYVELESIPQSEGKGYPELILDRNMANQGRPSLRSNYAIYSSGRLVNYYGTYRYTIDDSWFPELNQEFYFYQHDGYDHIFYKSSPTDCVILSHKSRSWHEFFLLVTYIYLLVFLIVSTCILLYRNTARHSRTRESFESRIRLVLLGTILLSFIFVGIASTYFNANLVRKKQEASIQDKTRSVMVFIREMLGDYQHIRHAQRQQLNDLLRNMSNGLHLDINVYDTQGSLVNTSRPEIYEKALFSRQISPQAFTELTHKKKPLIIQEEKLGHLKYLSSYFILYNWNDEPLGYVNVPFFISADELSNDTSDYLVVLINIYLIFVLLALFVTFAFARSLTRPLSMIRDKLAAIRLGDTNEPIGYDRKDEIGDLVQQYNKLLQELSDSADKLATSQRKLAWREMARQIAHEITNPLTPMKLNLQHLERAKKDGSPEFDRLMKKTVSSLIEQIDNLSRIASEFSSFAKMPEPDPGTINLTERLYSAISFFRETPNCKIHCDWPLDKAVFVYADGKQITQVLNNIIKNGIQAIPDGRKGALDFGLDISEDYATLKLSDNGRGIPEDIHDRLFEPNFTTKSSGMGLGLAIVKNIITNAGGEIWFETEIDKGTSFYFTLPLIKHFENE